MEWDIEKMTYLRRYQEAVARIDERMEEIMRLRARLLPGAQKISDMPGGGPKQDWTNALAGILEMEDDCRAECSALKGIRDSVVRSIETVQDGRYRALLDKRYIGGKTWEQISEELDCDYTTVLRWHGAALDQVVIYDAE